MLRRYRPHFLPRQRLVLDRQPFKILDGLPLIEHVSLELPQGVDFDEQSIRNRCLEMGELLQHLGKFVGPRQLSEFFLQTLQRYLSDRLDPLSLLVSDSQNKPMPYSLKRCRRSTHLKTVMRCAGQLDASGNGSLMRLVQRARGAWIALRLSVLHTRTLRGWLAACGHPRRGAWTRIRCIAPAPQQPCKPFSRTVNDNGSVRCVNGSTVRVAPAGRPVTRH